MKLNTMQSTLSEPTTRERSLLEVDIDDSDDVLEEAKQHSFLNGLTGDLEAQVVRVDKNTSQKLIIVTQDKALLTLKKNLARIGKREWIAPLSTVITILISLVTAEFKFALGLGPSEWKAIFIVSGFLATGWLAYALHKTRSALSFQEIVQRIIVSLGGRRTSPPAIEQ
jgi:hypothetical protein